MSNLRLDLKPKTFNELADLGRAVIPTLAPRWTDHNIHDPGIMMIELLAWIAEAQMYSISRQRRDERRAYAKLLDVELHGAKPACGLIWPFADGSRNAPIVTWEEGRKIPAASSLTGERADLPVFYTTQELQLTTARLERLETKFASGLTVDWTRANNQEIASFMPFGDVPAKGDRLVLTLRVPSETTIGPDSRISLGFEVEQRGPVARSRARAGALSITLGDGDHERTLEFEDTTAGLLESGVFLLKLGPIAAALQTFTLTVESRSGGFERPPRLRRIAVNVIPIEQVQEVVEFAELKGAPEPSREYPLQQSGLLFRGAEAKGLQVRTGVSEIWTDWTQTADLQHSKPGDLHFELDPDKGVLTFGNGINGQMLPGDDATFKVTYRVCRGSAGNLQAGGKWTLATVPGQFGVNRERTLGGADANGLDDLRAVGRKYFQTRRPLVTTKDVVAEAISFTDLGVTRAVELEPSADHPRGHRVLVVVGPHDNDEIEETVILSESAEFLGAVRSRLAPRIPLGQRLEVVGPRYIEVQVQATLVAARSASPDEVRKSAIEELKNRLAIVASNGQSTWPLGRNLPETTVNGWLRKVAGVVRVQSLKLTPSKDKHRLELKPTELPMLRIADGDITVVRSELGGAR